MKPNRAEWRGCEICGRGPAERHHIFPGPNRHLSEQWGMIAWLCPDHHRNGPDAAHRSRATADRLKAQAQAEFEQTHSRAEFMEIMGRNYREDDK